MSYTSNIKNEICNNEYSDSEMMSELSAILNIGVKIYDDRFPKYKNLFELKDNELYKITPLVIWNYNPDKGEMYRDTIVFDKKYYDSIDVYKPHQYDLR